MSPRRSFAEQLGRFRTTSPSATPGLGRRKCAGSSESRSVVLRRSTPAPAPYSPHSAFQSIFRIFFPCFINWCRICGSMSCSSCIQAADFTLTTSVPSRRTSRGVVTSAILAPTSSGHSGTTVACSIRRVMPWRRRYWSSASPSGVPHLPLKVSPGHVPAWAVEQRLRDFGIARGGDDRLAG
jgi:hypothetical protein